MSELAPMIRRFFRSGGFSAPSSDAGTRLLPNAPSGLRKVAGRGASAACGAVKLANIRTAKQTRIPRGILPIGSFPSKSNPGGPLRDRPANRPFTTFGSGGLPHPVAQVSCTVDPAAAERRAASRISTTMRLFRSDDRPDGLISSRTTAAK